MTNLSQSPQNIENNNAPNIESHIQNVQNHINQTAHYHIKPDDFNESETAKKMKAEADLRLKYINTSRNFRNAFLTFANVGLQGMKQIKGEFGYQNFLVSLHRIREHREFNSIFYLTIHRFLSEIFNPLYTDNEVYQKSILFSDYRHQYEEGKEKNNILENEFMNEINDDSNEEILSIKSFNITLDSQETLDFKLWLLKEFLQLSFSFSGEEVIFIGNILHNILLNYKSAQHQKPTPHELFTQSLFIIKPKEVEKKQYNLLVDLMTESFIAQSQEIVAEYYIERAKKAELLAKAPKDQVPPELKEKSLEQLLQENKSRLTKNILIHIKDFKGKDVQLSPSLEEILLEMKQKETRGEWWFNLLQTGFLQEQTIQPLFLTP